MIQTVSFTTSPQLLIESEETVSLHNFSLNPTPTASGTTVIVSSPNLSEFDLNLIET
ncbi:MAG: hypothetical protein WAN66_27880 [Limnoraphis robusta]|uniref:hypothetical protein n=1 Tax=Limnoraphis robusta TaxID=1118279 RepID=UPI002B2107A1|nr:hypothetical protein [Limnoraphis robusta]MEA5500683.1 hypothetical protein [Limnoraphis robusta BA-68 BA1]MEA5541487.1 hypothetical protein [Limnoraphis robusta Tam1]